MVEDKGKEAEENLQVDSAGQTIRHISLDQACALALRHARENTEFYGARYRTVTLVNEIMSTDEGEDFFDVRLSIRIAGQSRGKPGVEQFIIDDIGTIRLRQLLNEPSGLGQPAWKRPPVLLLSAVTLVGIVIATLAAVFLTEGGGCDPASTGTDCIAFRSERKGNTEIYLMKTDGSGAKRLTEDSRVDNCLSWSPDGARITFGSRQGGNYDIYLMNADGSGVFRLTNHSASDACPSLSPDAARIAFSSYRDDNMEIYVTNIDGSGQTWLTDDPAADIAPSWSPDAQQIAFSSNRDGSDRDGDYKIYVMNADGSSLFRLTNNHPGIASDVDLAWSPNGTRIAFSRVFYDGTVTGGIYLIDAAGTGLVQLTHYGSHPAWSPDGGRIAYQSDREGESVIYVVNSDGSNRVLLTNHSGQEMNPAWRP